MKGTEVTPEELERARKFLKHISGVDFPADACLCRITREQFVHVVAWYGSIRACGDGSGVLVSKDIGQVIS